MSKTNTTYVLWSPDPNGDSIRLHSCAPGIPQILEAAEAHDLDSATFWVTKITSTAFCTDWLEQQSIRWRIKRDLVTGKAFLKVKAS